MTCEVMARTRYKLQKFNLWPRSVTLSCCHGSCIWLAYSKWWTFLSSYIKIKQWFVKLQPRQGRTDGRTHTHTLPKLHTVPTISLSLQAGSTNNCNPYVRACYDDNTINYTFSLSIDSTVGSVLSSVAKCLSPCLKVNALLLTRFHSHFTFDGYWYLLFINMFSFPGEKIFISLLTSISNLQPERQIYHIVCCVTRNHNVISYFQTVSVFCC